MQEEVEGEPFVFTSEALPDWSDPEAHEADRRARLEALSEVPSEQVVEIYGRRCLGSLFDHPLVQDGIDELSRTVEDPYALVEYVSDRLLETLTDYVTREAGPGARVLDVGAGSGSLANFQKGYSAYPETSFVAVDLAPEPPGLPSNVEFVQTDLHRFELGQREPFDIAYAFHVFEHVPAPERLMVRLRSLLRPGASSLVAIPNGRGLHDVLQHRWGGAACDHLNAFGRDGFVSLMESTGFVERACAPWRAHFNGLFGDVPLPGGRNLGELLQEVARDLDRMHGDTRLQYYGWLFLFEAS